MKEKIEAYSKEKSEKELAAGFDHFNRVYKLAKKVAKLANLKYDDKILHAASFLHDIELNEPHSELSAVTALKFLEEQGFPKEKLSAVKEAIKEHTPKGNPKSNEAILLHDADLLDFLGATGVVRFGYATSAWWEKYTLQDTLEILKKFRKLASENLILDVSKKLAEDKIKFMDSAIEQLEKELK